jgi:hypothetical protein
MRFLIFLWNVFAVAFSFIAITLVEIAFFHALYTEMIGRGMIWTANILLTIFILWLIGDAIFRIIIGGGKGIIRYLISY